MKRRAIIVPVIVLALLAVGVTLYRNHLNEQRRLYSPGGSYRCSSNLQKIGIALLLYETGHQGRYPMRLEELLTPDGLQSSSLTCPFVSPPVANAFIFTSPGRVAAEILANEIIAHEPLSNHNGNGAMALFGDGHVEWMTPAELRDRLASPQTTRGTSSTAPTTSQSPGS
jgi:prepilin-type processing-associated H-X9-DG protein